MPAKFLLDCRNLPCPGPVTEAVKKMRELKPGDLLEVWADDLAAEFDLPAWCRKAGHGLTVEHREDYNVYLIRKKGQ
ncbi:MAG: hypothetical protein PWP65_767 [Clostridia bacterium]|nr:hypothetical protein [Clostridia bacterium]